MAQKFLRQLKGQPAVQRDEGAESGSGAAAAPKGPDPIVVRGKIKETVLQLLGNDDDFEDDNPLMEGGLDSLSAVQFRNDLVKEFGINLPASMTFDYPTIQALVAHVVEISGGAAEEEKPKGPDPVVVRGRIKETVRQLLGNDDDFEDDNPLMEGGLDSLSA